MKFTVLIAILLLTNVMHALDFQRDYSKSGNIRGFKIAKIEDVRCLALSRDKAVYGTYKNISGRLPGKAGEKLTYAVDIKIPKKLQRGYCTIAALFFDKKVRHFSTVGSSNISYSPEWKTLKVSFNVPEGSKSILLRLCHYGKGSVYLKKIKLSPAQGFDLNKLSGFSGTMDEKMILHSRAFSIRAKVKVARSIIQDDLPKGEKNALKLIWESNKTSQVSIGSTLENGGWDKIQKRRLKRVSFYYRVPLMEGKFRAQAFVLVGYLKNINLPSFMINESASEWKKMEYNISETRDISNSSFQMKINGAGKIVLEISGVKFEYDDGTSAKAFSVWKDPYWYYPELSEKRQFTGTTEGKVLIHFPARDKKERNTLLALKKIIPNLGIIMNLNVDNIINDRKWFDENGFVLGFQNITPYLWQAAVKKNALRYDLNKYNGIDNKYHKYDCSNPAWSHIYGEVAKRFSTYGIKEYGAIDCHFIGGDNKMIEKHLISFLKHEDEGVEIYGMGKIHFQDYFKTHTGFNYKPSDLGWKTWDDYKNTPTGDYARRNSVLLARKRGYLYSALRHYAFLIYNARIGREFKKYGIDYYIMNNGDNWNNCNDWNFESRCKSIPGAVEETFFYHPSTVIKAYYKTLLFREFYKRYGTKHRLIQETAAGGHGPIYWEPRISYLIVFTIAACGNYDSMQVDWPDQSCKLVYGGSKSRTHIRRVKDFVAKAMAFNHGKKLGSPAIAADAAKTVLLAETSTMTYGSLGKWTLRASIMNLNYPGTFATVNNFDLDFAKNAKIIINDYYALPQGYAEHLVKWLEAGSGCTLFLHGSSGGRAIDGTQWARSWNWGKISMNAAEQFKNSIGVIRSEGKNIKSARFIPANAADKVILKDASEKPLLSVYKLSSGSKIYYYHFIPGTDIKRDEKVIKKFFELEKINPVAQNLKGRTIANVFKYNDGSLSIAAFSLDAFKAFHFNPRVSRGLVYKLENPAINSEFTVAAKPGDYILFAFMSGEKTPLKVNTDKKLSLALKNKSMELFFLVPAESKAKLHEIENFRNEFFSTIEGIVEKLKK